MKRNRCLLILLFWVLPALACGLPRPPAPAQPGQPPTASPPAHSTATPAPPLTGWGRSVPGSIAPRATPTPAHSDWTFPGLAILSAYPEDAAAGRLELINPNGGALTYQTQPGDTLAALRNRFAVPIEAIHAPPEAPAEGLMPPGMRIEIDIPPVWTLSSAALLPDSEIVYGPTAAGFSVEAYVRDAGSYLNSYSELVNGEMLSGAAIVRRVALEMSVNPRILLAFLEYRSGWVLGQPKEGQDLSYPIGFAADGYRGLYKELVLAARQLSVGYYFWRSGSLGMLEFPDGTTDRISPRINAGTAAVTVLLSKLYPRSEFGAALYGANGFIAFYSWLFGDPWSRAAALEPQIPLDLLAHQPTLELPIGPGEAWKLTGGPHATWGTGSPQGALDFAPVGDGRACTPSNHWAAAAAPGVVTASEHGMLLLALDPSGQAERGLTLLYLHLADKDRAAVGTRVQSGDPLGHPSCEGGVATGTNLHIARKFNGEWLSSGPETPFILGEWRAVSGPNPYLGGLQRSDGTILQARSDGSGGAEITR